MIFLEVVELFIDSLKFLLGLQEDLGVAVGFRLPAADADLIAQIDDVVGQGDFQRALDQFGFPVNFFGARPRPGSPPEP